MSDIKQLLRERLDRARPNVDDALGKTLRRQQRRTRRKRGTAAIVAIAVFAGAGFGLWTAFRPGISGEPAGDPTPAPSLDQLARTALADAYGLELTTFDHDHPCDHFIDVISAPHQPEEATLGYCVETVPGTMFDRWLVAKRLWGTFPNALEQEIFRLQQRAGHARSNEEALFDQMRSLQDQLHSENVADPPTSCAGKQVTVVPEHPAREIRGTPGDDSVILYPGEQYVTNGGTDTICDPVRNVIGTVVADGTPFPQPYIPPLKGQELVNALQLVQVSAGQSCDGLTAEMAPGQRYCIPQVLASTRLARWRILTQIGGTIPTQEEIQAQALVYAENAGPHPDSQPTPQSEYSPPSGPTVAKITCTASGIKIETPVVEVQADGVHFKVDDRIGAGEIDVFPSTWDGGSTGGEFSSDGEIVLDPPPGQALVGCAAGAPEIDRVQKDAGPITITNPQGVWVSDQLACDPSVRMHPDRQDLSAFAGANPVGADFGEVLRRAIPGLLASDELQPAGYPKSSRSFPQWRVVRNGAVVGLILDPRDRLDGPPGLLRFSPLEVCPGTGIGEKGKPTAGMLGTPYELPDSARCDPYTGECSLVYISVGRYAALGGLELKNSAILGPGALDYCFQDLVDAPCGGQPKGMQWHALRMTPEDATAFEQRYGCGASVAQLCT